MGSMANDIAASPWAWQEVLAEGRLWQVAGLVLIDAMLDPRKLLVLYNRAASEGNRDGATRLPLWSAPIASAIMPGLGQVRLKKDRFVGYMAAEAFLLLQYAKNAREGNDNTREYRAIARDVARRNFPGTHPDTVWQYYEKVEKYLESGSYSLAVTGPFAASRSPSSGALIRSR